MKSLVDLLFGRRLKSSEEAGEKVGAAAGIAIFGLDALGSAAYGPEAALTILIPLGAYAPDYILPISASLIVLLSIVYFSYRQTIEAYPTGGGSYTVASQNLGVVPGLLAATALMIDYILTAAVGISAGIGALISAVPPLQPYTLTLCLATLSIVTLVNLRGVRDTGLVFLLPTYLFVGTLLVTLGLGLFKTLASGGEPQPVVPPPALAQPTATWVGAWLLLKAFSSGCAAMTGVEAVSNGVQAFGEPVAKTAQRRLTCIVAILALLLAGIGYLAQVYHIGATPPGQAGYESVLSQLTAAVAGKGAFYYVTIGSVLLVLTFQANTAFADFPRICRAVAQDGFLPYSFASCGRRLVQTHGIIVLAILCAVLLALFGGVTDRLIPLFAVGAFLAFTLSQVGMVAHWRKAGGREPGPHMLLNGLGALATGITVIVVSVAKFAEGAWVTTLLIPAIMSLMVLVRRPFADRIRREINHREAWRTATINRDFARPSAVKSGNSIPPSPIIILVIVLTIVGRCFPHDLFVLKSKRVKPFHCHSGAYLPKWIFMAQRLPLFGVISNQRRGYESKSIFTYRIGARCSLDVYGCRTGPIIGFSRL